MKKRWERLKRRFRSLKPRVLLAQLIVTLAYPVAKAAISDYNRLLIFTDALTIIALFLLIGGIFYNLYLHGDFDISAYLLKRGASREAPKDFKAYLEDKKREREEAFNYPLFLAIVYLLVSILLAYAFL